MELQHETPPGFHGDTLANTPNESVSRTCGINSGKPFPARQGITLFELLMVITIIGLLAALAVPAVLKACVSLQAGTLSALVHCSNQVCDTYFMA